MFPLLASFVSYSHPCRESGAEGSGLPPSSGVVCSEFNGKPVSSGALTSKRTPEGEVSGVPGFKGGVLIRLASYKKTFSFCDLMLAPQHLQRSAQLRDLSPHSPAANFDVQHKFEVMLPQLRLPPLCAENHSGFRSLLLCVCWSIMTTYRG